MGWELRFFAESAVIDERFKLKLWEERDDDYALLEDEVLGVKLRGGRQLEVKVRLEYAEGGAERWHKYEVDGREPEELSFARIFDAVAALPSPPTSRERHLGDLPILQSAMKGLQAGLDKSCSLVRIHKAVRRREISTDGSSGSLFASTVLVEQVALRLSWEKDRHLALTTVAVEGAAPHVLRAFADREIVPHLQGLVVQGGYPSLMSWLARRDRRREISEDS